MIRSTIRHALLAALAAPLMLGLAACGSKSGNGEAPSGAPIEKVAPPAGKSWSEVIAKTEEGGYRMGNPEAPIKLVEYASLTCPHCADFAAQSSEELQNEFVASGRVSYELRNFVRDPIDIYAAQLTRCGAPESYFALTEQVFANQMPIIERVQAAGEVQFDAALKQPEDKRGVAIAELAGLLDFFAARGISKAQAQACLSDSAQAKALAKATEEQGEKYEITGTPTFLVNGEKLDMNSWPEVKARLETMGAR